MCRWATRSTCRWTSPRSTRDRRVAGIDLPRKTRSAALSSRTPLPASPSIKEPERGHRQPEALQDLVDQSSLLPAASLGTARAMRLGTTRDGGNRPRRRDCSTSTLAGSPLNEWESADTSEGFDKRLAFGLTLPG